MRRSLVSLAFALCAVGCSAARAGALPPAVQVPTPTAATVEPPPKRALVTGCRATPSTVYGSEPVVFQIDGPASATLAEVQLRDQAERVLSWETVQVPGTWSPSDVPSGDFALQAGSGRVRCQVTVNRELPRATQALR